LERENINIRAANIIVSAIHKGDYSGWFADGKVMRLTFITKDCIEVEIVSIPAEDPKHAIHTITIMSEEIDIHLYEVHKATFGEFFDTLILQIEGCSLSTFTFKIEHTDEDEIADGYIVDGKGLLRIPFPEDHYPYPHGYIAAREQYGGLYKEYDEETEAIIAFNRDSDVSAFMQTKEGKLFMADMERISNEKNANKRREKMLIKKK